MPKPLKKALVVVLGDLARSPRMQYHCISLAKNNYQVAVLANRGDRSKSEICCEELEANVNIKQCFMKSVPDLRAYLPSLINYIIKPIWQSILLIINLVLLSVPDVIIAQNPPSIPTLPILFIYSRIFRSKLIIDWHNYGFSILSLNLRNNHPIVRASKWIEFYFGRLADAGFCVSEAMRKDLQENFNIRYPLNVLYDKPPKHYKPISLREKHNFFTRMKDEFPEFKSPTEDVTGVRPSTPIEKGGSRFTMIDVINQNVIMLRPNRPAVVVSSTSWTEDEDFGILLEALKQYDRARNEQLLLLEEDQDYEDFKSCLPSIVCIITGKGPLKAYYQAKIKELALQHVEFILPWLSPSDYATMVASCDLGVSLHKSSSGVDLPMKVVDMFGCGIPALAYHYPAINELVVEDFYGLTFKDTNDLLMKFVALLKDFYIEDIFPQTDIDNSTLGRFRKNIKRRFLLSRWEDNWDKEAKPVFDRLSV